MRKAKELNSIAAENSLFGTPSLGGVTHERIRPPLKEGLPPARDFDHKADTLPKAKELNPAGKRERRTTRPR